MLYSKDLLLTCTVAYMTQKSANEDIDSGTELRRKSFIRLDSMKVPIYAEDNVEERGI